MGQAWNDNHDPHAPRGHWIVNRFVVPSHGDDVTAAVRPLHRAIELLEPQRPPILACSWTFAGVWEISSQEG